MRPLTFRAGNVELASDTAFDESKLKDPEVRLFLEKMLAEFFGGPTTLGIRRLEPPRGERPSAAVPKTIVEVEESARQARRDEKGLLARERPAVKAVCEELGGTIAKVRVIDDG